MSELRDFIQAHPRLAVITGAGVSTRSGIPDYRDEQGEWKRARPVEYRPFMTDPRVRQRYWARSTVCWPIIGRATPNGAHRALARLEDLGRMPLLITQNVDGLHTAAGSRHTVDLHGRIDTVRCMQNGHLMSRAELQRQLLAHNPGWSQIQGRVAPDGDFDIEEHDYSGFVVPDCPQCGGLLKPDVVFFGENVPRERVDLAFAGIAKADALLIVGSSLMVYSGFRFAEAAAAASIPIAAVNLGRTRADHLLSLRITAPCDEALSAAIEQLSG